jgi:phage major head subunit gpT-like protein
MIINSTNLANLFRAYKAAFQKGFLGADPMWQKIATKIMSSTSAEDYGWLGDWPQIRKWIGDRHIKDLKAHHYSIINDPYESTVSVRRDTIEDDQFGVYATLVESMGQAAAEHPDELIFTLLAAGASTLCYDGQNFFDTDHPVGLGAGLTTVSNYDATGGGNLWCLMDTKRPLKPLIFQVRKPYKFVTLKEEADEGVFMRNEYRYGVDARGNAGFGFWQMAYGSLNTLNDTNVKAARTAMRTLKSDNNRPLYVSPNILLVGPSNEDAAKELIGVEYLASGASNPLYDAFEVIVSPHLT